MGNLLLPASVPQEHDDLVRTVDGAGLRGSIVPSAAILPAALLAGGAALLLLRVGSGQSSASARFAALPEFAVWVWLYAAEVGAALAFGMASFPAFWILARSVGRRGSSWTLGGWVALGALLAVVGPRALGEHNPLWLGPIRFTVINALMWVFVTPSFAGLVLAQLRLSALSLEVAAEVNDGRSGRLVAELLWLRTVMLRFLSTFAAAVTGALLTLGALRLALIADGMDAVDFPALRLLTYGGLFTVMTALIFVPTYAAWQERTSQLREALHPIPPDGRPPHEWFQARDDLDHLLDSRLGVGRVLTTAFGLLAPLGAGVLSALLSSTT